MKVGTLLRGEFCAHWLLWITCGVALLPCFGWNRALPNFASCSLTHSFSVSCQRRMESGLVGLEQSFQEQMCGVR